MTCFTNYLDIMHNINTDTIIMYLEYTGWNKFDISRLDITIYQYETSDILEQVTIPLDKSLSDYYQALYYAIVTISKVEHKSLEQIMLFLLNPNADIIKLGITKENVICGNISFNDAIKLYENTKKLIATTLLDVLTPQTYHNDKLSEPIQDFLNSCSFGQTEFGGYIISIICPFAQVKENYKPLDIFKDNKQCINSTTRQITLKLFNNINTIKNKLDNSDFDGLIKYILNGYMSVDFLESLTSLCDNTNKLLLDFKLELSPILKSTQDTSSTIRLSINHIETISSIISKIKTDDNYKYVEIIGRINDLYSSTNKDTHSERNIGISYIDENDKQKNIDVSLTNFDYKCAMKAHQDGKYVKIIGELNNDCKSSMSKYYTFCIID